MKDGNNLLILVALAVAGVICWAALIVVLASGVYL
jgi:hypothetical protein